MCRACGTPGGRGVLVVTLEVDHLEVVGVDEVKLCPCCECSRSRGVVPVTSYLCAIWR